MSLGIDYTKLQQEEARLILLKELAIQPNESLSSSMMEPALERFAIYQGRAWIHAQLDYMAIVGAVVVTNAGTVKIATITPAGKNHLARRVFIDGIKVPSTIGTDV